ncbi:MAG: 50S ribosomal protein L10 [Planctomycetota bacterium]|nr:50S ribosomal protein L10 [Planctomycetota bacterium]
MSKYVKSLVSDHVRECLDGVNDALLVNVIGMDANASNRLRGALEEKNINLLVVKNSLAARATADTPLGSMFEGLTGTAAVCWGGEDIVSLAKQVAALSQDAEYAPFEPRGGVMDGDRLDAQQVIEVSKWPNREEQLSILLGQILSPGANLVSQLTSPASALASQVAQKAEGAEEADSPES